jgi:hypothetical protein
MTQGQKDTLAFTLDILYQKGFRRFRHGDCIGADEQAACIAKDVGFYLICHPGHPKDPNETKYRAFTNFNDEVLESFPFLKRDQHIVDGSGVLVAAPYQDYEVRRSGTWTTVRYARSKGTEVMMIYSGRKYQQRGA